jgi:Cu-Zn family superoxide dismutase
VGGGANDVIGKAVVVHRDPDDYKSQPAGNSGPRIACGLIQKA